MPSKASLGDTSARSSVCAALMSSHVAGNGSEMKFPMLTGQGYNSILRASHHLAAAPPHLFGSARNTPLTAQSDELALGVTGPGSRAARPFDGAPGRGARAVSQWSCFRSFVGVFRTEDRDRLFAPTGLDRLQFRRSIAVRHRSTIRQWFGSQRSARTGRLPRNRVCLSARRVDPPR